MAGTARPNYPEGRHPAPDNVRRLQNRLWAAAKQSPGRRFHAVFDRIHRPDVLWEAWRRVRANRGAAGIDGLTLAAQTLAGQEAGRNLRAGQADRWTRPWFHDQGLHQLMGTIRYPKAA